MNLNLPWWIWICRVKLNFPWWIWICCSEFEFAVSNLNLPLSIWICRNEFEFAVVNLNLMWWITKWVNGLLSQGYKVNRLSNTFKKFYGRHWSSWTIHETCLPNVCWFYQLKWFLFLMDLPMAKLIKLDKMAGVMHRADHTYSIPGAFGDCIN